MGGDQAALVLSTVRQDGLAIKGEAWPEKDKAKFDKEIRDQYESQGNPYYASARLWDDGVIDPVDTRKVLGQAISASMNRPRDGESPYGIFRM
jgi:3-methylcrotonyl-CoA carboxylase beta subunit